MVALSDAWQKGAQQLTFDQRVAFANDPLNLQSTDGPTNQQKGAGDAATWLPPNTSYRCEYVARQVSVKATYTLWVTQAEHDAMVRILSDCNGILAPTNQVGPSVTQPAGASGDGSAGRRAGARGPGSSARRRAGARGAGSCARRSGAGSARALPPELRRRPRCGCCPDLRGHARLSVEVRPRRRRLRVVMR